MNPNQKLSARSSTVFPLACLALLMIDCSGGGGSGDETITVRLATDQACYGVAIDVDQEGLSETERGTSASCLAAPAVSALGCDSATGGTAQQLRLSTSACFTPNATSLFQCTVSAALAERFRESTTIRCGCGCADPCPAVVDAAICDQNGENCTAAQSSSAQLESRDPALEARSVDNVTQVTPTSSTTNYCGTCCDAQGIETGVAMASDDVVREIRFDLAMPVDEPDCPEFERCVTSPVFDGPSTIEIDGDNIHVCLSGKSAVSGAQHLFSCDVNSDGSDTYEISGVAALDARLRPVLPAPTVINDFGGQ